MQAPERKQRPPRNAPARTSRTPPSRRFGGSSVNLLEPCGGPSFLQLCRRGGTPPPLASAFSPASSFTPPLHSSPPFQTCRAIRHRLPGIASRHDIVVLAHGEMHLIPAVLSETSSACRRA